jgi:glycosyltransferase involved in cell wall biosynthesis
MAARVFGDFLNVVLPGKPRAAAILVANERTRLALPKKLQDAAILLVENGVDLSVWESGAATDAPALDDGTMHVVFMGRLVDWKAVDLLLLAFEQARTKAAIRVTALAATPSAIKPSNRACGPTRCARQARSSSRAGCRRATARSNFASAMP